MHTYHNLHTQNAYLTRKCVLTARTLEEGKCQAKLIKILKSQAKFTLLMSGNTDTDISFF